MPCIQNMIYFQSLSNFWDSFWKLTLILSDYLWYVLPKISDISEICIICNTRYVIHILLNQLCKGAFNNYVDIILPFCDHPPVWTVFIPWAWTKTDIFWPPPPSSCPRSYWMPPKTKSNGCHPSFYWLFVIPVYDM